MAGREPVRVVGTLAGAAFVVFLVYQVFIGVSGGLRSFFRPTPRPAPAAALPTTNNAFKSAVALVDSLNAGYSTAEVERFIREATVANTGVIDVEKLGALLRPKAIQAGKLVQLQQELRRLASGEVAFGAQGQNPRQPSTAQASPPPTGPSWSAPVPGPPPVPEPQLPTNHPKFPLQPGMKCGASWMGAPDPSRGITTVGWHKQRESGGPWYLLTEEECPSIKLYEQLGMKVLPPRGGGF